MKQMWSEEELNAKGKKYLHNIKLFGTSGIDFNIRIQFYSSSKRKYALDEIKFLATHENILTTGEDKANNEILSAKLMQWDNEYFKIYCCEYKDSSGTLAFEEINANVGSIKIDGYSVCDVDTLEFLEYL